MLEILPIYNQVYEANDATAVFSLAPLFFAWIYLYNKKNNEFRALVKKRERAIGKKIPYYLRCRMINYSHLWIDSPLLRKAHTKLCKQVRWFGAGIFFDIWFYFFLGLSFTRFSSLHPLK